MMFVFGYIGSLTAPSGWPIQLMHVTETALVTVAFVCGVIAIILRVKRTQRWRDLVAVVGGISAGFGLVMPFELAPFFFGARGEVMLGTIALILVYPIAAVAFVFAFRSVMTVRT